MKRSRRMRCSSVTYGFRYAPLLPPVRLGPPCRRPILIATKYMLFRGQGTSLRRPSDSGMDKTLLLFINREWTNPFLDWLMATFTSFDVWMPILFVAIVLLLWRGDFQARSFVIVTLLTIGFTDGVFTQSMKKLVDRPRPSQALAGVREVSLEKATPASLGVSRPVQGSLSNPPDVPS